MEVGCVLLSCDFWQTLPRNLVFALSLKQFKTSNHVSYAAAVLRQFTWSPGPTGVNLHQVSLPTHHPFSEARLTCRKLPKYPALPPALEACVSSCTDGWKIRYSDRELPGTELFKCATSLMSVSYCLGWTLIMNYEQLLGRRGGMVISEAVSHAESPESNHV